MNYACAFFRAYFFPRDDAMFDAALRFKLVKRAVVNPADHLRARQFFQNLNRALSSHHGFQSLFDEIVNLIALTNFQVCEFGMYGAGDIGSESPRRSRPREQKFILPASQREPDRGRCVRDFGPLFARYFMLRDACAASRTPR